MDHLDLAAMLGFGASVSHVLVTESRLLIHATLVFFLIFKDASHLIIFYFQIVFGMRGKFVIALSQRASEQGPHRA